MSESEKHQVVGIDLGTTNSAVAWCGPTKGSRPDLLEIPQLVAEGEVSTRDGLSSAIYLAGEIDVPPGALALPWQPDRREALGELGRRLGARHAGRLVVSAKSWLSHRGVDRQQPLLPWGSDEVSRLSPVEASTRILAHLVAAWEYQFPRRPLAEQDIVLTVPASFDEVGRELTVAAAAAAGLPRLRLLEEPQAALYAWAAAHPDWRERLAGVRTILVVDVGGGTTDFSLVEVRDQSGGLGLERTFVGRHLLLGGDNMDLALAQQVRHETGARLDAGRWQQLTALCREAKEVLLAGVSARDTAEIALAGRGRSVVAGAVRATLAREQVLERVVDGFFPRVSREDGPQDARGEGLQEFGLPYEADPAITRHLAGFLRSAAASLDRPEVSVDAILFNGGALQPPAIRERVLDVVGSWQAARPRELEGADLNRAVARGAAVYGLALRGLADRISGGAARSFYLGIGGAGAERLLCLTSRGMEEGEEIAIDEPALELVANRPIRFPLYASTTRLGDPAGCVLEGAAEGVTALPPLGTVLRFGRSLEERQVPVRLRALLAETGTLEVFCESRVTDHRWKLSFDLRAQANASSWENAEGSGDEVSAVVADEAVARAIERIEATFGGDSDPVRLMRALEDVLELRRDAWPIEAMRALWDSLFAFESARERSAEHEARWLNLAGYLLRPGYGDARDEWRGERLWRLHAAGPRHEKAAQVRSEWWTLWKRAAGALSRPQQTALLQDLRPLLLPSGRRRRGKKGGGSSHAIREMWQVVGSLERLPAAVREEVFALLASRVGSGRAASEPEVWALGRLGARVPVYGPADSCVRAGTVAGVVEAILSEDEPLGPALGLALAQMGRVSTDLARDLSPGLRERLALRLESEDDGAELVILVRQGGQLEEGTRARVMADSLPAGLRLAGQPGTQGV